MAPVPSLDRRLQTGHTNLLNGAAQYRFHVSLNECAQYGQIMLSNVEPTGARARGLEIGRTLAARPSWAPG